MRGNPRQVEGLDINHSDDGFVVYDQLKDRVHFLNHTAVMVLELCEGKLSAEEIAGLMARTYDLDQSPIDQVDAALEQLRQEGLIRSA